MKLRITPDSLRLRVSQSDLARFIQSGRIEETIQFSADDSAKLTYAMELSEDQCDIAVRYQTQQITLLISNRVARHWERADRVGIYGTVKLRERELQLIVEKDFACLDGSDKDNLDTFPNPKEGTVC